MSLAYGMQLPVQSQSTLYAEPWEAGAGPGDLVEIARAAEHAGFDYLASCDHVAIPRRLAPAMSTVWYDPVATLSYLAAVTERVRLLSHVAVVGLRHPLITAKQYATLDHLSGGRLILGVGAGHVPEEFAALGADFDRRGAVLDESVDALRAALGPDEFPEHHGKLYDFEGLGQRPRPAQEHVPLWVGGSSPAAVRRAALKGDGWLPQGDPRDRLPAQIERIRRLRDEAARDEAACEDPAREDPARGKSARGEDAHGKPAHGKDAHGKDARGKDAREEFARGKDAREEFARGKDAREEFARGGDARGEDAHGKSARGEDARGGDARDEFARGGDAREEFARGGDARDEFARGGDARDESARGGAARGEAARDESARGGAAVRRRREPFVFGAVTEPLYVGEPAWDVGRRTLSGAPEAIAESLRAYPAMGVRQIQVRFRCRGLAELTDQIAAFGAEVAPHLGSLD